jgi:hypothetical protein
VPAILAKFGTDEHERIFYGLLHIRQTGTVDEYWSAFSELKHCLGVLDPSASEKSLVMQFLHGLCDDVRAGVELHAPATVAQVATQACK